MKQDQDPSLVLKGWLARCADRYANKAGLTSDEAQEFATACAEHQIEAHGAEPTKWQDPADAVDDDMSDWGE